jgi:hypothetical protein
MSSLLDNLLTEIEKDASAKDAGAEKVAEEKKMDYKEGEKPAEKKEKKEEEKKEEASAEVAEKSASLKDKLSSLSPEMLDKLAQHIDEVAEGEKVAELAKEAEELETQGRFMYHGFAKEQIKTAYALGQIDDEEVVKIANDIGWSTDDIFKVATPNLPGEEPEPVNEGAGTQGGPASDEIKAPKKRIEPAASDSQKERPIAEGDELAELKSVINDVKAVRQEESNLEYNDDNH